MLPPTRNLSGYLPHPHRQVYWNLLDLITKNLQIEEILTKLFNQELISTRDMVKMTFMLDNHGAMWTAEHLILEIMMGKPDQDSFDKFVAILREADQETMADALEEELKKVLAEPQNGSEMEENVSEQEPSGVGGYQKQMESARGRPTLQPQPSEEEDPDYNQIPERDLNDLSEEIGSEWRTLGRQLGILSTKLEQFRDEHLKLKDAVCEMLCYWNRNSKRSRQKKIELLSYAVDKCGRNDLIKRLRLFKSSPPHPTVTPVQEAPPSYTEENFPPLSHTPQQPHGVYQPQHTTPQQTSNPGPQHQPQPQGPQKSKSYPQATPSQHMQGYPQVTPPQYMQGYPPGTPPQRMTHPQQATNTPSPEANGQQVSYPSDYQSQLRGTRTVTLNPEVGRSAGTIPPASQPPPNVWSGQPQNVQQQRIHLIAEVDHHEQEHQNDRNSQPQQAHQGEEGGAVGGPEAEPQGEQHSLKQPPPTKMSAHLLQDRSIDSEVIKLEIIPLGQLDCEDRGDENCIGQGSFGRVLVGKLNGEEVAVKVIKIPDMQEDQEYKLISDCEHDIQIMAKVNTLHHPNIVQFKGFQVRENTLRSGEVVKKILIVGEFVDGNNLQQILLKKTGKREYELNFEDKLKMMMELASALQGLHKMGVTHRDIKPSNILISHPSHVLKLCDLGLAKTKDSKATRTSCRAGSITGTLCYAAREIVIDGKSPTKASDIYSYGASMLELLTEKYMWGKTEKKTIDNSLQKKSRPVGLDEIEDDDVRQLLKYCLDHDPQKRPTAQQLVTYLKKLLKDPLEEQQE